MYVVSQGRQISLFQNMGLKVSGQLGNVKMADLTRVKEGVRGSSQWNASDAPLQTRPLNGSSQNEESHAM
jgi:hypothetical protein